MSYARTYPNRPARTNTAGNSAATPPAAAPPAATPPDPAPEPRQLEHRGGYAVKAPDPAKRDKIQRVADAEAKSYERYKQEKKSNVQYVTTNAAVGTSTTRPGVPASCGASRNTQIPSRSATKAPVSLRSGSTHVKPPSLRSQTLRMEDPEIERRKATQREKAEALQAKQVVRQADLDVDRRRKNDQFLRRLEGKR